MKKLQLLAGIVCLFWPAAAAAGEGAALLTDGSGWRVAFRMETPVERAGSGLQPASKRYVCTSPPVAPGWTAPDFDDAGWPRWQPAASRGRGKLDLFGYGFTVEGASSPAVAAICLRGRFLIADPARAGSLKLALAYRGGAVVHVNGREVARGHLPDGELAPEAVADDYPADAFVKEDKLPIRVAWGDPGKYKESVEKRIRRLEAAIDAKLLRPGVNVLTVELRRAAYLPGVVDKDGLNYRCGWGTCGLVSLALTGGVGAGNGAASPAGVQVWNHPSGQKLGPGWQGDPGAPPLPVRMAGARNGAFSGQVAVSSASDLKGVKASASDLKSGSGGVIPASAVRVRYGLDFDGLEESGPADAAVNPASGAAVQPVWVTVHVPRDAAAGTYTGTLTVEANGRKAAEVPLEISVAPWTVPDPKDFRGFIDVVDSPRTLALQYGVPEWSEEHWKLLDRQFELMGRLGSKCLYIMVLPGTYFGNEHSMIRWVGSPERAAEGPGPAGYRLDFGIVERYLDTALKHMKPEVVAAYVWDRRFGMVNYTGRPDQAKAQDVGVAFTISDPATGKLSTGEGPKWGTPESRTFWQPVIAGLKERLEKRGLGGTLVWGLASDRRPRKETVEDLKALAPEVHWSCHSHPLTTAIHGQPVRYIVHVWGCPQIHFGTIAARKTGWNAEPVMATFPRMSSGGVGAIYNGTTPLKYRAGVEGMMICGYRGLGRVGGFFWPVIKDGRGRGHPALRNDDVVGETWGIGFEAAISQLFAPGKSGPVATIRSEAVRENQQEVEARVALERALKDPAALAKLGEPLAAKCRAVLDERGQTIVAGAMSPDWLHYQHGLRERAERLFAAAAEVAARLK